jgi:hypothetical protein
MQDKALTALNGHKGGAPIKLTRKLAHEICSTLAQSPCSLVKLCQSHPEWPSYESIDNWRTKREWFARMLWQAREAQADTLAQDSLDLEQRLIERQDSVSMAAVQANRVVMENRRWYTGKVLKRVYGDDPAVSVQNAVAVQVSDEQLRDLRERLDRVRSKGERGSERPALIGGKREAQN